MLLCCLRCTLKPSASAIVISKLYQHFREHDLPCGLQDSLPTLNLFCSLPIFRQLRHRSKARYGWVASPYKNHHWFLPDRDFHPARYAELYSARERSNSAEKKCVPRTFALPGSWSVATNFGTPGTFFSAVVPCYAFILCTISMLHTYLKHY